MEACHQVDAVVCIFSDIHMSVQDRQDLFFWLLTQVVSSEQACNHS